MSNLIWSMLLLLLTCTILKCIFIVLNMINFSKGLPQEVNFYIILSCALNFTCQVLNLIFFISNIVICF